MQTKEQSNKNIIRVHNAWGIYKLAKGPNLAEAQRPEDWGNKVRWQYHKFIFQWIMEQQDLKGGTLEAYTRKTIYINHCHIWTEEKIELWEVPIKYGHLIGSIQMPGQHKQHCSNKYLRDGDDWQEDWGPLPPYYDDKPVYYFNKDSYNFYGPPNTQP